MDSSSCIETTPYAEEKNAPNGFDVDTAAVDKQATELLKPEKLTPLLQEDKSA